MESKKNSSKGKKVLLASICGTLALTIGALIMYFPVTYNTYRSLVKQNKEYNVVKVDGEYTSLAKIDASGNYLDDDFKILAFTDMHLDTHKANGNVTIEMLVRNISSQKPDLVVFVGDNVTSALNTRRTKQLAKLMEELGVYWTLVLGNHEGDNKFSISRQKMIGIFASYPHCLVEDNEKVTKDGEALWGAGNHVINLLDSKGEIRQSLYFFDGGADMTKEDLEKYKEEIETTNKRKDDYIKDSQIQWYKETVSNIDEMANKTVKSVIFCHIPLVEFNTAYEKAMEGQAEAELLYGAKLETVCSSGHNNGLFELIYDLGSTQAFVSGHDHVNNFTIKYKGIILTYNQNSGYSSYNVVTKKKSDTLIQGFTAYIINKDGELTMQPYLNADLYPDRQEDILKLYQ